jgi:sulfite reductase (NADPH) flavoprotein alpha-component
MSTVPFIPDTAPFSAEQRAWLNGFFAGLFSRTSAPSPLSQFPSPSSAVALQPLTILFGSQTGTAEGLAKRVAKEAGKRSFAPTVLDMAQCDLAKLASEKNLLVLTSTYGDGEPPDNAKALHTALHVAASASEPTRPLTALRFSVLALGDTNYTQFCKCGADFDLYLEKLGATRAAARADCDLDYEEKFTAWLNTALTAFGSEVGARLRAISPTPEIAGKPAPTSDNSEPAYSKKNPFPALLITSRNLSAPGSAKQINHIELDLTGSGLVYEAGDALGVLPHNCPALVADVLAALVCDGEEAVPAPDGSTVPLRRALTEFYDLGKPSPDLLALFALVPAGDAAPLGSPKPSGVGGSPRSAAPHHVIDALLTSPSAKPSLTDFIRALKKIQPRLYSISSSPRAHTNQVHLTVGAVRYDLAGRARKGVCSTFLADRAAAGETRVGVFVHANKAFRPPASGDTPMIMVGPGTGIAPFRAFLEERRAAGARGKNWLFFGDQREAADFIYRDELRAMQADGTLTRLDLAWSRDQQEKIYVQHRMTGQAAELFAWLEQGAHFYVCGDASRMAKDVDAALHTVIERAGKKSADEAAAYVQALKAAKRYARDVY